jgi:hypothetical protein
MCDCISKVDVKLAEHNARIMLPLIGLQRPFVTTIKINSKKRGKAPFMFASFCPFCGTKYSEDEAKDGWEKRPFRKENVNVPND